MKLKRLLTGILAALALTLTSTGIATADDYLVDDPVTAQELSSAILGGEVAFDDLSDEQAELLEKYSMATSETVEVESDIPLDATGVPSVNFRAANSCYTARHNGQLKNVAGMKLASYWYLMKWCTNGSNVIKSASIDQRGYDVHWVGWSFDGFGQSHREVQPPSKYASGGLAVTYQQWHFKIGLGDIAQHKYPCLRMVGGTNGSVSRGSSCS